MPLTRRDLLSRATYLGAVAASGTLIDACATSPSSSSPPASPSAAASPAITGSYEMRVGVSTGPDTAATLAAQRWAELLSQRSQGHVKMQVFPSAQLGSSPQLLTQTTSGALDGTIVDTQNFINLDSRFSVLSLPYLFAEDKAQALFSSKIGKDMLGYLEPKGVKGLAWGLQGLRGVINRTRNVAAPPDFSGMKIRSPEDPLFLAFWQQLKAQPVSLPGSEIYLSLSRGVIDGADTSAGFAVSSKFYEVAKFYTNTAHSVGLGMIIFSFSRFQQLPPEVQAVVKSSAEDAGTLMSEVTLKQDKDAFGAMRANGMTVVEKIDVPTWKAAVKPVFDKFAASAGPDLVGAIEQAVR